MQKLLFGVLFSATIACGAQANSLTWVAEHLSIQQPIDINVSSVSILSLIAISNQTWAVNLIQKSIQYDSPIKNYVQVEETWQSDTGIEWQYSTILPESDYFETESMKSLMGLQYLNMQVVK